MGDEVSKTMKKGLYVLGLAVILITLAVTVLYNEGIIVLSKEEKLEVSSEYKPTLLGALEIYPVVLNKRQLYPHKRMFPLNHLTNDYNRFGNISFIEGRELNEDDGEHNPTLPGAYEIYPAVFYKGQSYYWKRMYPLSNLTDDYSMIGKISFIGGKEPKEDLQFSAIFNASGKVFFNETEPDVLIVLISTAWMKNKYFIFDRRYFDEWEDF